jgi:hypothetical protein
LTISLNAGKVSEWRSMIGTTKLEQLNAATQPTLVSGVSVNCPIGTGMASPTRGFTTSTSRTIAAVSDYSDVGAAVGLDIDGWVTGCFAATEVGGKHTQHSFGGSGTRMEVLNAAAAVNTKVLTVGRVSATQVFSKVNGGTEVSQGSGMPAIGGTTSGVTLNHYLKADFAGSNYSAAARFYELVICYGTELTTLEVSKLEGYLAHSTGTTGLLPGGHPYKTLPPYV